MNYYKAREQDTAPYLVFDLVATSLEELERLKLQDDPLVVTEKRLTNSGQQDYISYEFGICHLRIQNGELAPRPVSEIDTAELQLAAAIRVEENNSSLQKLAGETFVYDGHNFPMNEGAAKVYEAIFNSTGSDYEVISLEEKYILKAGDIAAFKQAYFNRVLDLYENRVVV